MGRVHFTRGIRRFNGRRCHRCVFCSEKLGYADFITHVRDCAYKYTNVTELNIYQTRIWYILVYLRINKLKDFDKLTYNRHIKHFLISLIIYIRGQRCGDSHDYICYREDYKRFSLKRYEQEIIKNLDFRDFDFEPIQQVSNYMWNNRLSAYILPRFGCLHLLNLHYENEAIYVDPIDYQTLEDGIYR